MGVLLFLVRHMSELYDTQLNQVSCLEEFKLRAVFMKAISGILRRWRRFCILKIHTGPRGTGTIIPSSFARVHSIILPNTKPFSKMRFTNYISHRFQ